MMLTRAAIQLRQLKKNYVTSVTLSFTSIDRYMYYPKRNLTYDYFSLNLHTAKIVYYSFT